MKIEFINAHHRFFSDVKQLGSKNSSTLGFMPEGGFLDHANKKYIVVAYEEDRFAGYLMFRVVPRLSRIAIVHLCVHDEFRGKNISSLLLNALRDKFCNSTCNGILLSCRADYKYASAVWKRYGFVCKQTKRSRSIDENYLNVWWYDFNIPNLFTVATQSSIEIKALLDANIIIKLRDNTDNFEPAQDPRGLLADWLVEEIDYYYAPEINNEISRDENKERVKQTRSFLSNFTEANIDIEECKCIAKELRHIIVGATENDQSDRVQLATAIVSEASYFITLDLGIIEKRSEIEEKYDIQIFTPQELILEVDQLINKEEYSPAKLAGVTFHSISKVSNSELNSHIDLFLNKASSENKKTFQNIVCNEIANIKSSRIKTIKAHNKTIAFFGYKYENSILSIHFIRITDTELKQTLFMQLISDFISKAIRKGLDQIHIQENFLSDSQKIILNKMGFDCISEIWVKIVHNKTILCSQVNEISKEFSNPSFISKIENCPEEERVNLLFQIERKLFPLKFLDLKLPCYIIPIKPYWAGQLFDPQISGATLFGADEKRFWNFENVYYRSTKPITELAPARILWYASHDKNTQRSQSVIASSYLDEVMTGKPKDLFRQNKHYGIYEWKNIYDLCKQDIENPIRALRFSGTEVFYNPISLSTVQNIFIKYGKPSNTFASPVLIGNNIFNHLYQLGTNNGI